MKNLLRRAASFTLASSVMLSITACGESSSNLNTSLTNDQASSFAKKPAKDNAIDQLVLVHLAASNNLYQFGLDDINEMEAGLNNPKVKIVVLFDGAKPGDSAVYEIEKDPAGMNKNIISKKVANTGLIPANNEIDSGDPKLAAKFITWAVGEYPANHHSMIYWNHGSSWLRERNSFVSKPTRRISEISTNDFCWDDDTGNNMVTADLNQMLAPAVAKIGKKFDVLNFDACLQGHAEIGTEAASYVDFLVASQKTEPGKGNDYVGLIKGISANSSMNSLELSKTYVRTFGESYPSEGVTLSSLDLSKVTTSFATALNTFADAMTANLAADNVALQEIAKKTTAFENADCRDIGHFASMVAKDARVSAPVRAAADAMVAAVKDSIVANVNSANKNAMGTSLFFPAKGQRYNAKYDTLKFSSNKWDEFLKAFTK